MFRFTKSDIQNLARIIQETENLKYTKSLRIAENLSKAIDCGALDMMWRMDQGKLICMNGSLSPIEAHRVLKYTWDGNESPTFGVRNTGPGHNQIMSLDDLYEPSYYALLVTDDEVSDFYEETGEEIDPSELIPEDDAWSFSSFSGLPVYAGFLNMNTGEIEKSPVDSDSALDWIKSRVA